MDFRFTPEQDAAAELAAQILRDKATNERMKAVEAEGDRFDRDLWSTLSDAFEWNELDLITLCRVLVEVGRAVAPVPLATHGPAALLLAEHGTDLGTALLTAAVAEPHAQLPAQPTVTAAPDGTLSGTKTLVRAGMAADQFLVIATTDDGAGVHLVAADAPGLVREAQHTSDRDATALIRLDSTPATRIGDTATATRLVQLLTVCAAAEQLGVTEGALALTSTYAKTREQFKRPIGTFQAVAHRLADGYIDVLGQRLTLWQAVWRLEEGLDAETEVAVAKLWAADAGHRLAHTTTHVHGGVGIDLDGEAHRYFTSAKRFEFTLGGATEQALTIGRGFATA